jgi:hypothetical protein
LTTIELNLVFKSTKFLRDSFKTYNLINFVVRNIPRAINYELQATSYELRDTTLELQATNYEIQDTSYELGDMKFKSCLHRLMIHGVVHPWTVI